MSIKITYIAPNVTKELRHLVLRQGKPLNSCDWEGDYLESTKHIGAFLDFKCVGILSLFEAKTSDLKEVYQYQLRGMAVHPEHQGKAIGKKLIAFSENELRKKKVELLWCNARESAINFYKKLNFEIISDCFDIPDVGPHFKMSKKLK